MAETLQFDLVSPERILTSVPARSVQIPAMDGDMTAMPNHAPFLTTLRPGVVRVTSPTQEVTEFVVTGGFAEVSNNKVIVLAETATRAEDIDTERAAKAKARAEERLRSKNRDIDQVRAEASLQRAVNRLSYVH